MSIGFPPLGIPNLYTPSLKGATDDPVPTYATQVGRYFLIGLLTAGINFNFMGWYLIA